MKKSMLLFYLALYLTNAHASGKLPSYEIPEGMTEHEFAVSMLKGENSPKTQEKGWDDMTKDEQDEVLLVHSRQIRFDHLSDNVKFSAYSEIFAASRNNPETVKGFVSTLSRLGSLGNDALFPVYYELLSANRDKPELISHIIRCFAIRDGFNLASSGEQEAMKVLREIISKDKNVPFDLLLYLVHKGNRNDIALLEKVLQSHTANLEQWAQDRIREEFLGTLQKRVDGNFVVNKPRYQLRDESCIIPSVANTGPQGVYAFYILLKMADGVKMGEFPDELLTMTITFDGDGNPVSSVDLAKYGLSMPVITPKPGPNAMFYPNILHFKDPYFKCPYDSAYTVTFPHETKVSAPQVETDEAKPDTAGVTGQPVKEEETPPPTEQPEDPPSGRTILWLTLALLALLAGSAAAWRKAKRK